MKNKTRFYIFLILLFIASLYRVGSWGVTETSEARYAEISREMSIDNDFTHPKLLNIQHFHKPPVTYAITAIMMKIFGHNEFAARFLLQIAFILQIFLLYKIALILYQKEEVAFWASAVYATLPLVLFSVRGLTTDAFVNTFVLLSIYFLIQYLHTGKRKWQYFFTIIMGINFLTKGPVGLIFPLLLYFPLKKHLQSKSSFSFHTILAIVIFFVISLSWYVKLVIENQEFLNYFVFKHTVERFATAQEFSRNEPWWYFLVLLPATTLPWIFIIFSKIKSIKNNKTNWMIFIFWIMVPLIFFSISSSKRILYVLPITGGIALISGEIFSRIQKGNNKYSWGIFAYYVLIFLGLVLYQILDSHINVSIGAILFFLLFLSVAIFIMTNKKWEIKNKILVLSATYIVVFLTFSTHFMSANDDSLNSTKNIAQFIKSNADPDAKVLVFDRLLPSLSFELDGPIYSIFQKHPQLVRETQFETGDSYKKYYININKNDELDYLKELLHEKHVLISRKKISEDMDWLKEEVSSHKKIGRWHIYY